MTTRRDPLVVAADIDADGRVHLDMPSPQFGAILKARFAEQRVDVEVRLRKTKRSDRQNRLLWALLTPWAHDLGYTPVELKDELLGLLWGWDERVSPLTGEVRQVPTKAHSSALSTAEFTEFIDFMVMKAAETGYVMELPDDVPSVAKKEPRRPAEHDGARASDRGGSRAAGMTPAPRWDGRHARTEGRTLDAAASTGRSDR